MLIFINVWPSPMGSAAAARSRCDNRQSPSAAWFPRRGATGASQPGKGRGENPAGDCPRFAEQGEANKKVVSISNALQKTKAFLPVSPPAPSPSRSVGVPPRHPAVHLAANGATPPLKGRGVFPKASHNIEAREALSVRCFPFYDSLR